MQDWARHSEAYQLVLKDLDLSVHSEGTEMQSPEGRTDRPQGKQVPSRPWLHSPEVGQRTLGRRGKGIKKPGRIHGRVFEGHRPSHAQGMAEDRTEAGPSPLKRRGGT